MSQGSLGIDLAGHWPFTGDLLDCSGNSNHGAGRNVALDDEGAVFNGKDSHVEIKRPTGLDWSGDEFTVAAWIHTEKDLADTAGDVMSRYDPESRKGFNLSVKTNAGGPVNQPNRRNVHFGVDSGSEPVWTYCGRPGNNRNVGAFVVHEGKLYAGTSEPGENEYGHVYSYKGDEQWDDCGHPDMSNCVSCLASYEGDLYAVTVHNSGTGSLLTPALNTTPGGAVCRYDEGRWIDCGQPFKAGGCHLTVFRGRLLATASHRAGMYFYEGGKDWSFAPTPEFGFYGLAPYDGHLYFSPKRIRGKEYPDVWNQVYRYAEASGWEECGSLEGGEQVYGFAIHRGELFAGTWDQGRIFRSRTGCRDWVDCGACGYGPLEGRADQTDKGEIMGMAVYNGKLYVGTLPYAEVYRYDGDHRWTKMKRLDFTPGVPIRRAWAMAVYDGRLFVGTLPSGEVHCMEAGKSTTSDRELGPGWKHLAAVRQEDRLSLYVDGAPAATSTQFRGKDFDLSAEAPLRIGFGAHDYFCGKMRDVRLYSRALGPQETARLAKLRACAGE